MKQLFLPVLLSLSFASHSQAPGNQIVMGTVDSVHSEILKENRKIWVRMPDTAGNGFYSKERYPVVFLLDGDVHFYATGGIMQFLGEVNNVLPKMILVGIRSNDRMRDLTPSHDRTVPRDSNYTRTSGGGEQFTAFLEKELIPYIDAHYPTAPYRVLIGHSLGGLLVINTLINHPALFNAYVALDPALYWDNQKVLKQAETVLAQKIPENKSLFMGVSDAFPPGMDTAAITKDTTLATIFIRPILRLDNAVKTSANKLHYSWRYYPGESHNTLPLIATYDALHFIFDFYKLPEINHDSATADFYRQHYDLVSAKMGYQLLPPEEVINGRGYYFLGKKMVDRARPFFQMNIDNYPGSYNTYDSMSDLYAAEGNKDKAIELLNKELTLMDKPYIREKLRQLKLGK